MFIRGFLREPHSGADFLLNIAETSCERLSCGFPTSAECFEASLPLLPESSRAPSTSEPPRSHLEHVTCSRYAPSCSGPFLRPTACGSAFTLRGTSSGTSAPASPEVTSPISHTTTHRVPSPRHVHRCLQLHPTRTGISRHVTGLLWKATPSTPRHSSRFSAFRAVKSTFGQHSTGVGPKAPFSW